MNDWYTIYSHYVALEPHLKDAREIVVEMIMREHHIHDKAQAQDFLSKIIADTPHPEIKISVTSGMRL